MPTGSGTTAGSGSAPVYLTLDIDCCDPAFAPGTGTPEIGGMTTSQVYDDTRVYVSYLILAIILYTCSHKYYIRCMQIPVYM